MFPPVRLAFHRWCPPLAPRDTRHRSRARLTGGSAITRCAGHAAVSPPAAPSRARLFCSDPTGSVPPATVATPCRRPCTRLGHRARGPICHHGKREPLREFPKFRGCPAKPPVSQPNGPGAHPCRPRATLRPARGRPEGDLGQDCAGLPIDAKPLLRSFDHTAGHPTQCYDRLRRGGDAGPRPRHSVPPDPRDQPPQDARDKLRQGSLPQAKRKPGPCSDAQLSTSCEPPARSSLSPGTASAQHDPTTSLDPSSAKCNSAARAGRAI